MKQKKTQIIFYFFLLIILSFSTHARVVDSPGFFIDSDCPFEEFGEMSTPHDPVESPPVFVKENPGCTRNPTRIPEDNCSALRYECLDGCYRCIGRNDCDAEVRRKAKICKAVCQANFNACMGWL